MSSVIPIPASVMTEAVVWVSAADDSVVVGASSTASFGVGVSVAVLVVATVVSSGVAVVGTGVAVGVIVGVAVETIS